MEETIAVGRVWHNACFTCGGANGDGCKRTLHRDSYVDHNNQPYCNACYGKMFKPKGFGIGTGLNTDFGVHDSPAEAVAAHVEPPAAASHVPTVQSTPSVPFNKPAAPAPAAKSAASTPVTKATPASSTPPAATSTKPPGYTPTNHVVVTNQTPKCTVCAKSVYKMEEMIAVGRVWHALCFTCGGTSKTHDGCGKVLHRDGYLDHDNQPYCNACYSKHFKPKGFSVGAGLNTDYGPAEAANEVSKVTISAPPAAAPAARPPAPAPAPAVAPTVQTLSNDDMNSKFHQAAILKSNVPQSKASIKIGASTAAIKDSDLHKESGYVGDNDEVDESEW